MSIHISVESIQGKQRKEIIEEIKQRAKEAALYAIKEGLEAGLEAEVEHQLGRKKGGTRCISRQPLQIEGRCRPSALQHPPQLLRDGPYHNNFQPACCQLQ